MMSDRACVRRVLPLLRTPTAFGVCKADRKRQGWRYSGVSWAMGPASSQTIASMQVDHGPVENAAPETEVAIKVG